MATVNLKRPTDLLGRHVHGVYCLGSDQYTFDGPVEAVILPAPGFPGHEVELYVNGEYVSLSDCRSLDYGPAASS